MSWKAGQLENWGIFIRRFWGVYIRHSQETTPEVQKTRFKASAISKILRGAYPQMRGIRSPYKKT
jgi:hypothetical protein